MTRATPLVLLVDDDAAFLEIISMKLKACRLETAFAHNADDGFKQAQATGPDLVLSDILMPPGPNGLELARALVRDPATSHVKLAFFTSLGDPWRDLSLSKSDAVAAFGNVPIFDKCSDMDRIGDHVLAILQDKYIPAMA